MKQANPDIVTDPEDEAAKDPDDALAAAKTLAMFAQHPTDHRPDERTDPGPVFMDSDDPPHPDASDKFPSLNDDLTPSPNTVDASVYFCIILFSERFLLNSCSFGLKMMKIYHLKTTNH